MWFITSVSSLRCRSGTYRRKFPRVFLLIRIDCTPGCERIEWRHVWRLLKGIWNVEKHEVSIQPGKLYRFDDKANQRLHEGHFRMSQCKRQDVNQGKQPALCTNCWRLRRYHRNDGANAWGRCFARTCGPLRCKHDQSNCQWMLSGILRQSEVRHYPSWDCTKRERTWRLWIAMEGIWRHEVNCVLGFIIYSGG